MTKETKLTLKEHIKREVFAVAEENIPLELTLGSYVAHIGEVLDGISDIYLAMLLYYTALTNNKEVSQGVLRDLSLSFDTQCTDLGAMKALISEQITFTHPQEEKLKDAQPSE